MSVVWRMGILAFLVLAACAEQPVAYIGAYGEYAELRAGIAELLAARDLEVRFLDAEPPAGISGPAIIYGDSAVAKRTAQDIAYELHALTGQWFLVRSVSITNHSYSPDYLGIYLVSADHAAELAGADTKGTSVVATRRYGAQSCEAFVAELSLEDPQTYSLRGSRYDTIDQEMPFEFEGPYHDSGAEVRLINGDRSYNYRRELADRWADEPVARERLKPTDPQSRSTHIFSCAFLQELDAVVQEQVRR